MRGADVRKLLALQRTQMDGLLNLIEEHNLPPAVTEVLIQILSEMAKTIGLLRASLEPHDVNE